MLPQIKIDKKNFQKLNLSVLPSPCFVIDLEVIRQNLDLLKKVKNKTGVKILLALKAFSLKEVGKLISKSLNQEQKKYNLKLSGGDTTNSKKVSFSVTSIGFSNNIIERNNAKLNDDIYVTGNIGDSFLGLKVIKNKIKINSKLKNYFVNQFYCPNLPYKIYKQMHKFSNTSMDISDGIITDMSKLINKQKLSFEIEVNKIPISKNLDLFLKKHKKLKIHYLFNGDDYQILFTASKKNRSLIKSISKRMNQKITKIGKINNGYKKNTLILDNKSLNLTNFKGYSHKF